MVPVNQILWLAAGSTERAGERKTGEEIGGGDADSSGGGVKLRLSAANVGAAQEKFRWQADGNGRRSGGDWGHHGQFVQKRGRLTAEENAQAVDHLLHILLEQRNPRFIGGDLGLGVGDIEAAEIGRASCREREWM